MALQKKPETDFLEFVKDLLNIVKEESHKRMIDAEEMARRTRIKRTCNGISKVTKMSMCF